MCRRDSLLLTALQKPRQAAPVPRLSSTIPIPGMEVNIQPLSSGRCRLTWASYHCLHSASSRHAAPYALAARAAPSKPPSSPRPSHVPVPQCSVPREESPPDEVHALLPSSRPHGPPAAVSIRMHTLVVACDFTTKQILSQEPSLGSDLGDDGELEGCDADPGMGGRLFGVAAVAVSRIEPMVENMGF